MRYATTLENVQGIVLQQLDTWCSENKQSVKQEFVVMSRSAIHSTLEIEEGQCAWELCSWPTQYVVDALQRHAYACMSAIEFI